ncbi:MAG: TonB-dependent receptor [Methyloglobulus sp.]|nr:TonB-dependent receptor [Methyloglobulus sp.]
MTIHFNRHHLIMAFITLILCGKVSAESIRQQYHIPAQPLNSALMRFASDANLELLYTADKLRAFKTGGLDGSMTPAQAISKLLQGSGMTYRFVDAKTVTVETPDANFRKTADVEETPEAQSSGSDTTLPKVTVEADYDPNDPYNTSDPYNKSYSATDATTATKTDTPIMETPASIQVVPRAVANDQQAIRLQDITKNVSGVQQTSGFGDFYDQFLIRGFDSGTDIYRLRNGARVPNMTFETANLDRVEVLKGPASILYGRIEPGGLINAVTRKPLSESYYALSQQFGSYDLYRTTLDATGPLTADGSLLYRLDFAYLNKGSYRDFMGKERKFIAPSLTWKPTDALEFNLNVEYRDDDTVFDPGIPVVSGVNGAKGHLADVPRNRSYIVPGSTESFKGPLVEFNWSYHFNDDWKIRNGITATFVDNKYIETFPLGVGNKGSLPLFLSTGNSIRDNYTAYFDVNGHFETLGIKHNVLIGADTYYERTTFDQFDVSDLQINNIFNPVYPQVDVAALRRTPHNDVQDNRGEWYGVYFQDQLTFFDKLHLLLGGRYNWANISSGSAFGGGVSLSDITLDTLRAEKFTPRAGIVYQVAPWLSLYGNYVESFGGNNGRSANGQPFAPQTATQYEGGIKTEFLDGKLTGNLAFYHITKENLLTRDTNSTDPRFQRAIGEARSQGIEFDLNGKLNDQISLIATYAFNDARITKDSDNQGNRLRFAPEHSASFWVKYEPIERFSLGTGVYLAGQRQGNTANTFSLPGYARWDAMAAYRFDVGKSHLTAQVNVNNILNKSYFHGDVYEIGGLPAEPLTVLGSLRLEY